MRALLAIALTLTMTLGAPAATAAACGDPNLCVNAGHTGPSGACTDGGNGSERTRVSLFARQAGRTAHVYAEEWCARSWSSEQNGFTIHATDLAGVGWGGEGGRCWTYVDVYTLSVEPGCPAGRAPIVLNGLL